MNGNKIYESLIESVINNYNATSSIMFIKHYNSSFIPKDAVEKVVKESTHDNGRILYYNFCGDIMQSAYAPLMDWIKQVYYEEYSDMTPEEFVDRCNVYALQKEVISSFIRTGRCERNEEILYSEVDYETKCFSESIRKMIQFIAKEKYIVIVLNDLQYANPSVIYFLTHIIEKCGIENCSIIVSYNEAVMVDSALKDDWEHLVEKATKSNLIYENIMFDEGDSMEDIPAFVPLASSASDYIVKIRNMIYMLGVKQAQSYLDMINQKIEQERFDISDEDAWKIYKLTALLGMYNGDYNKTFLNCEKMRKKSKYTDELLDYANEKIDKNTMKLLHQGYDYYYIDGIAHANLMQSSQVEAEAQKCMAIANLTGNKKAQLKARILKYICRYNGWNNIYDIDIKNQDDCEDILKEIYNARFYNLYAHLSCYSYNNDKNSLMKFVANEDEGTMFNKGLNVGMQLGNEEFLIVAYMKNIVLCSEYGYYNYVERIYNKMSSLVDVSSSVEDEGNMYNGLGYNYTITEQYSKAASCFDKALRMFINDKKSERTVETLYNMGLNYIGAGEYAMAASSLEQAIKIMEKLKIHEVVICNEYRLYSLIALCDYYMGLNYNCYSYISRVEFGARTIIQDEDHNSNQAWDQTLYYYHLVEGLLMESEGKYENALVYFKRAERCKDRAKGRAFIAVAILAEEKAALLRKMGREEEAVKTLKEAVSEFAENGLRMKAGRLASLIEKPDLKAVRSNLTFTESILSEIDEMVKVDALKKELGKKNKRMGFITMWQDSLRQDTNFEKHLLENSMITLINMYSFVEAMYVTQEKDNIKIVYSYKNDNTLINEEGLMEYFSRKPAPLIITRNDSRYFEYRNIFKLLGTDRIETLMCVPLVTGSSVIGVFVFYSVIGDDNVISKELPDEEELTVVKWACNQLYDALERIKTHNELEKMNEKLKEISVTDNLTGLLNRQGMTQKIEEFKKKDKGVNRAGDFLLYFDLDNFKYYNDRFGHGLGDKILVKFAQILMKVSDGKGIAIRYGGDEFIMIILECDKQTAELVAANVHSLIDERLSAKDILTITGTDESIPKEKILSCSIGITRLYGYEDDAINKALKEADVALYAVKHTTKNGTRFFGDCAEEMN